MNTNNAPYTHCSVLATSTFIKHSCPLGFNMGIDHHTALLASQVSPQKKFYSFSNTVENQRF